MKKEAKPKEAILNSYIEPTAYKEYILFRGKVIVRFVKTS
jgi:hypothetical protein